MGCLNACVVIVKDIFEIFAWYLKYYTGGNIAAVIWNSQHVIVDYGIIKCSNIHFISTCYEQEYWIAMSSCKVEE